MTVWCWVQDLSTGHRYDIALSTLNRLTRAGAVREVPGRRRPARNPRPAKHYRPLGGPKRPAPSPADTQEL